MKWNTLKYLFKEGIVGLWKNRLMAFASAGTIVLCLLILGISYSIGTNIDFVLNQLETKFGVTAYISDTASPERINEIKAQIAALPNVTKVGYISKEEAFKLFTKETEDEETFSQFQKDNPLPASFEVQVNSIEFQDQVVKSLKQIPELEINYFQKETGMYLKINDTINLISSIVILFLVVIGVLLMANTIKLTVYVRRKEINIMKYIGATDRFIRLPFLIEGVVIGFLGSLISVVVMWIGYQWAQEALHQAMKTLLGDITLRTVSEMMHLFIPMALGIGLAIGFVGSSMAIRKHLKV